MNTERVEAAVVAYTKACSMPCSPKAMRAALAAADAASGEQVLVRNEHGYQVSALIRGMLIGPADQPEPEVLVVIQKGCELVVRKVRTV